MFALFSKRVCRIIRRITNARPYDIEDEGLKRNMIFIIYFYRKFHLTLKTPNLTAFHEKNLLLLSRQDGSTSS